MPERDLELICDAAVAAGRIASRHFRSDLESWDKGGGQGPVSEADLEIDRMLKSELLSARPDYGWLSEESVDDPVRLNCERVFVVDPIDGTRAFIAGQPTFSHSIGVAEHGRIIAACVFLPEKDRMFSASLGGGARCNGGLITPSTRQDLSGARYLGAAANLKPEHWPGGVPDVDRHWRSSLAYRLCLIASGRFDLMMTFRDTWEWDIAAGDLIAREAGAIVSTGLNDVPLYNNATPKVPGLIVAPHPLHKQLIARR